MYHQHNRMHMQKVTFNQVHKRLGNNEKFRSIFLHVSIHLVNGDVSNGNGDCVGEWRYDVCGCVCVCVCVCACVYVCVRVRVYFHPSHFL